jgi:hypothetical protein
MKSASQIHLSDVQAVYSGPEGRLWQLLMGEMRFLHSLAKAGKIIQGLIVAEQVGQRGGASDL